MTKECEHHDELWNEETREWNKSSCEKCLRKWIPKMLGDRRSRGIVFLADLSDNIELAEKICKEWEGR